MFCISRWFPLLLCRIYGNLYKISLKRLVCVPVSLSTTFRRAIFYCHMVREYQKQSTLRLVDSFGFLSFPHKTLILLYNNRSLFSSRSRLRLCHLSHCGTPKLYYLPLYLGNLREIRMFAKRNRQWRSSPPLFHGHPKSQIRTLALATNLFGAGLDQILFVYYRV
jgi:hypothetical protein